MKNRLLLIVICLITVLSVNAGVYRALLSQQNTAAPTAIVLENTLGGTPTFARFNSGGYVMCLANAFPDETKIFGLRKPQLLESSTGTTLDFMKVGWDDFYDPGSCLIISTYSTEMQTGATQWVDSRLQVTPLEIRVYP